MLITFLKFHLSISALRKSTFVFSQSSGKVRWCRTISYLNGLFFVFSIPPATSFCFPSHHLISLLLHLLFLPKGKLSFAVGLGLAKLLLSTSPCWGRGGSASLPLRLQKLGVASTRWKELPGRQREGSPEPPWLFLPVHLFLYPFSKGWKIQKTHVYIFFF